MLKKILFCSLFFLVFFIPRNQDSNAQRSEFTIPIQVQADSIIIAIDSGNSVLLSHYEILGPFIKEGSKEQPDTIKGVINIWLSTFYDTVSLVNCYFMKNVICSFTDFGKGVDFRKDSFSKRIDFLHVQFKDVGLSHVTFNEHVEFNSVNFAGYAYFLYTTFGRSANFSHVTFNKDANFQYAIFRGYANFSQTTFEGSADFSQTTFDGYINFLGATFYGQVNLNPKEFKNIYITWEQLKGHLFYDPPANYKLMKYFEENRQLDDADGVYLFLKNQERVRKHWYLRYPEFWVFDLPFGYGAKPLNTLYLSIGIVILFALFYTKCNAIKDIEQGIRSRNLPRFYQGVTRTLRKRFYYALYFSVHTFIVGVVTDWHPTDEFLIGNSKKRGTKLFRFRTLSMVEGALGWVLLAVFVVTLTRKFIR
jgi:hypothetical protein